MRDWTGAHQFLLKKSPEVAEVRQLAAAVRAASIPAPAARPLRILMIAARTFPFVGGIETHVHEVCLRLAAKGHSVEVLTTDNTGRLPAVEQVHGVNVTRVAAWPRGADLYWAPGIMRHVAKGNWDVIHIQGYHTFSAPIGMLAASLKKIPFVITFHSGGHSSRVRNAIRRFQHAALAPLVARSAHRIGVSDFEVEFFSERMGLPRNSFTIVPNGARLVEVKTAPRASIDSPLILSVGRLERYKGHHRAIAAFGELLKRIPDARLGILGDGPYEPELRHLVARLKLGDKVTIGGIPASQRAELARLMGGAALVVLLSEYEAHPVAVMEALSLGVPVLTSDTSGFRELARAGLVRAVSLNSESGDIATAMQREINEPCASRSTSLPDWDECASRLEAIYRSVAASHPTRSEAPLTPPKRDVKTVGFPRWRP